MQYQIMLLAVTKASKVWICTVLNLHYCKKWNPQEVTKCIVQEGLIWIFNAFTLTWGLWQHPWFAEALLFLWWQICCLQHPLPPIRTLQRLQQIFVAVNESFLDDVMLTVSESLATNFLGSGFHTSMWRRDQRPGTPLIKVIHKWRTAVQHWRWPASVWRRYLWCILV